MRTMQYMNWAVLMAFISLGLIMSESSAVEGGLIEMDYPHAGEARVEVNLAGALFALAAKAIRDGKPEASEFLASLKSVRVRIYDEAALGGKSFDEVLKFYRQQLQKWDVMACVKEKDSRVGVYSFTEGDVVSGLTVLIGNPKEVVVVNLAGKIDITKLSQIDEITGVDLDLPEFNLKEQLPPEKKKRQKEQKQKATKSFFDGDTDRAIVLLEELEEEGISNHIDYALMAVFHHSMGALDKSYYYLGRLYESEDFETSTAFYEKAVEINPQSEAAKRLDKK